MITLCEILIDAVVIFENIMMQNIAGKRKGISLAIASQFYM